MGKKPAITVSGDDLEYPFNISEVKLIFVANDRPQSLSNQCIGGNFFSARPDDAEFYSTLFQLAVETITQDVKMTLYTMAKKTFDGKPLQFIAILLCSTSTSQPVSPSAVLDTMKGHLVL